MIEVKLRKYFGSEQEDKISVLLSKDDAEKIIQSLERIPNKYLSSELSKLFSKMKKTVKTDSKLS